MRAPRIQARLEACPRCDSAVILALDSAIAAIPVRADPVPLDAEAELQALLEGRTTYTLHIQTWTGRRTISTRLPEDMPRRDRPVIADHRCPGPIPATAIPPPPPDPDDHREPDLFTPVHDEPPEGLPF